MFVLGIQYGSHDTSATIVRSGELIAIMEQERFNKTKHTLEFPADAIRYCLEHAGITLSQVDVIAYAGNPDAKSPLSTAEHNAKSSAFVLDFFDRQSFEKILVGNLIINFEGPIRAQLVSVPHHLCHAASSYYMSPFEEAALFTVDGLGNWVSATGSYAKQNTINQIFEITYPHSLGFFYGAVTQFLGFCSIGDEAKVMGLAGYGKPIFLEPLRQICRYEPNSIILDLDYFTSDKIPAMNPDGSVNTWYSDKFAALFGEPRLAESVITERDKNLASSVQALLEERVFQLLRDLSDKAKSKNLCLAGGVALNSSLNGKISSHTEFKNVFIIPCANDGGLSLGAALHYSFTHDNSSKRHSLQNAYFGSSYEDNEIEDVISKTLPGNIEILQPSNLTEVVAQLLNEFSIVGWFQGRMEFGPRALGNRSILANPTRIDTKTILNRHVKFREEFRPFGPIVLLEHAQEYFETDEELPFMLKVVNVRKDKRALIPSVTHIDGTARVQTLSLKQNPLLYSLLEEMKIQNGIPLLLNTSFNVRQETIVRTPLDAIRCFISTGMNALAIGKFLLLKRGSLLKSS